MGDAVKMSTMVDRKYIENVIMIEKERDFGWKNNSVLSEIEVEMLN